MTRLARMAGLLVLVVLLLAIAAKAFAAGPQTIRLVVPVEDTVGPVCSGERVPARGPRALLLEVLKDGVEVWRYSTSLVYPGDTLKLVTPSLADGEYRIWTRLTRDGVKGCTANHYVTVSTDSVAPQPRRYVLDRGEWRFDAAVRDSLTGQLLVPHELARRLNALTPPTTRTER